MHAVVGKVTIHDFERGRTLLREQAIPRIRQLPGFVAAQFVRLDENTGSSMVTFETEEAARAAAEQIRANPPGGDAITLESVEIGEVVERA